MHCATQVYRMRKLWMENCGSQHRNYSEQIHDNKLLNFCREYFHDFQTLMLNLPNKTISNFLLFFSLLVNSTFHYTVDFDLVDKNGKEFIQTKNPQLTYVTERSYYHLDNLFNGNKLLGSILNYLCKRCQ